MQLTLKNCVLRSWRMEDAAAMQRYANNRRIWANLRDMFPHLYTMADAEGFLKFVVGQEVETVVAIATAFEAIGCIGLRLGEDVHRKSAELGYWLAEPFWGRGIMSEAVRAFTEHCFATFDLNRIYSELFATNAASARVLEKAGFTCEGRMRNHAFKDGQVLDSLLYARVR